MKKLFTFLTLLIFSFNLTQPLFSADSTTPEPYDDKEFPQALKDLRRFEIITLGSMPFVMLDCNIVYSGIQYAKGETSSFNPLDMSSYDTEQQKGLILTSLSICVGIGLTDFIVQKIKVSKKNKKNNVKDQKSVLVIPLEEDPDAIKINPPDAKYVE